MNRMSASRSGVPGHPNETNVDVTDLKSELQVSLKGSSKGGYTIQSEVLQDSGSVAESETRLPTWIIGYVMTILAVRFLCYHLKFQIVSG